MSYIYLSEYNVFFLFHLGKFIRNLDKKKTHKKKHKKTTKNTHKKKREKKRKEKLRVITNYPILQF